MSEPELFIYSLYSEDRGHHLIREPAEEQTASVLMMERTGTNGDKLLDGDFNLNKIRYSHP